MSNTKSDDDAAIFSLRIVSVDTYMKAPILGLDTCYSEFRGNEIKQVPIIRVFGTDANGVKTCAHIHGIFPYLYIPYAGIGTQADADRLAYQLATSLDKAINISLSQGSSSTQHVYKVIVVKGMPFYGYHQKEHKYMKIFLYNPGFIRRAANLLQNGAILGRIFQPHESHVPFNLQFMIDFNLYGMSFLHVPSKVIKYRQSTIYGHGDYDVLSCIDKDPSQLLPPNIERMSTCKQEMDVNGVYILNRFQVAIKGDDNEHANPGIAFIWSDERSRRIKLGNDAPPLVVSQESTQSRTQAAPADSEMFHRTALNKRLEQLRTSSPSSQLSDSVQPSALDQTLTEQPLPSRTNRKFNLNQFLSNSVYPAECDADDLDETSGRSIWNASYLIDHLGVTRSGNSFMANDTEMSSQRMNATQFDLDDTIVDEDLVLSLTKTRSSDQTLLNESLLLDDDEHNVLDIFEQLEDSEQNENDRTLIDSDSALAPLTQTNDEMKISQTLSQNKDNAKVDVSFEDNDSDDDLYNVFSMSMIDCIDNEVDNSNEKSCELPKISQLDGADDSPPKRYGMRRSNSRLQLKSPSRKKYRALDIQVSKSPIIPIDKNVPRKIPITKLVIERCDSIADTNSADTAPPEKSPADDQMDIDIEPSTAHPIVSSIKLVPYAFKNIVRKCSVVLERSEIIAQMYQAELAKEQSERVANEILESKSTVEPERRYPKRNRVKRFDVSAERTIGRDDKYYDNNYDSDENKLDALYSWYAWSECKLAFKYDKERDFYPQPGPSTVNYYEDEDIKGYHRPVLQKTKGSSKTIMTVVHTPANQWKRARPISSPPSMKLARPKHSSDNEEAIIHRTPPKSDGSDWENDVHIQSFYEQSFCGMQNGTHTNGTNSVNSSPRINDSQNIDPNTGHTSRTSRTPRTPRTPRIGTQLLASTAIRNSIARKRKRENGVNGISAPDDCAPRRTHINGSLDAHEFPKEIHPKPYYSNRDDALAPNSKKEVGHNVLQLTGNSILDLNPSAGLTDSRNMAGWQKAAATNYIMRSRSNTNRNAIATGNQRKAMSTNKSLTVRPNGLAPTAPNVEQWLTQRESARERHQSPTRNVIIIEESPVKLRREAPTCVLPENDDESALQSSVLRKSMDNPVLSGILANKNLTVSVRTKCGGRNVVVSKPEEYVIDVDSDDDVICVDDYQSSQLQDPLSSAVGYAR